MDKHRIEPDGKQDHGEFEAVDEQPGAKPVESTPATSGQASGLPEVVRLQCPKCQAIKTVYPRRMSGPPHCTGCASPLDYQANAAELSAEEQARLVAEEKRGAASNRKAMMGLLVIFGLSFVAVMIRNIIQMQTPEFRTMKSLESKKRTTETIQERSASGTKYLPSTKSALLASYTSEKELYDESEVDARTVSTYRADGHNLVIIEEGGNLVSAATILFVVPQAIREAEVLRLHSASRAENRAYEQRISKELVARQKFEKGLQAIAIALGTTLADDAVAIKGLALGSPWAEVTGLVERNGIQIRRSHIPLGMMVEFGCQLVAGEQREADLHRTELRLSGRGR